MQPGYQQGSEPMWWWKVAQHLDEAQLAFANAMSHNVDDPRLMHALYDRLRDGQAILLEIFRAKGLLPGATNGTAGGPMPGGPVAGGPMGAPMSAAPMPGGPVASGPMAAPMSAAPMPGPMPMPVAPMPPPMPGPMAGMAMPFPPMRADDFVEIPGVEGPPPLGVNEPAVAEADHAAAASELPTAEPSSEPVGPAVIVPEESTAPTAAPVTEVAGG